MAGQRPVGLYLSGWASRRDRNSASLVPGGRRSRIGFSRPSMLAAVGYRRLRDEMAAEAALHRAPAAKLHAIGARYVRFAAANPGLFLLMFRGEKLDMDRPVLREASAALLGLLGTRADLIEKFLALSKPNSGNAAVAAR